MVGLGTMGRNFLLNVADNGFSCVGFDINAMVVARPVIAVENVEKVPHASLRMQRVRGNISKVAPRQRVEHLRTRRRR